MIFSQPFNYNENTGFTPTEIDNFSLFISNETLINSKIYELDVFIKSTRRDFNLRLVQLCITINPNFIQKGAEVIAELVPNSSQLKSYNVGKVMWVSAGSGFQVSCNTGGTCENGTLISALGSAIRIGKFRLTIQNNKHFQKTIPAFPKMILSWSNNPSGLILKTAVSKWNSIDCSDKTAVSITNYGTYN